MASKEALTLFLESLKRRSYYDILRIPRDCTALAVKLAFHDFARLYHPDCHVSSSSDAVLLAAEIYRRGVESYRCLSRPASRAQYDAALSRGQLREASHPSPPPPPLRTLETIATSPRGKQHAKKADRLIAVGNLEEARVQLISASQCEPDNNELAERIQVLYEALALEPT
jgi:curved DNA-binding protein CbpA